MKGMKLIRERAFKRYDTRIRDAEKGRTFEVTERDIAKAICKDHQRCAFARAIKRKTGADFVDVSASRVLIKTGARTATRWLLSPMARKQIRFFDTHESKMAPRKIELLVPHPSSELGARNKRARSERRIGAHTKHRKRKHNPTR